ncbi:MAG TPA: glycosyltransferase [Longimicrobiales bacterium]|nr:glycosyltransferase [Longimicrobiales bacterium]
MTSGGARTLVVVPTYNEALRLDVAAFAAYVGRDDGVGFLFVDDGSSDDTPAVLERLVALAPERLLSMRLERNGGKAEAVRRGVLAAAERGAELVGYWDADLATPLDAIVAFREVLEAEPALHLVMGARIQLLGRRIERRPARHYFGRAFATTASVLLGVPVYDTQCGAKLFRATPEMRLAFSTPFGSRWIFDVELLARMMAWGGLDLRGTVYEYPLTSWSDVAGSRLRGRDFFRAPRELAAIYWRYVRRGAGAAAPRAAVPGPLVPHDGGAGEWGSGGVGE